MDASRRSWRQNDPRRWPASIGNTAGGRKERKKEWIQRSPSSLTSDLVQIIHRLMVHWMGCEPTFRLGHQKRSLVPEAYHWPLQILWLKKRDEAMPRDLVILVEMRPQDWWTARGWGRCRSVHFRCIENYSRGPLPPGRSAEGLRSRFRNSSDMIYRTNPSHYFTYDVLLLRLHGNKFQDWSPSFLKET